MKINSLAYRTDIFIRGMEGEVLDRGEFLVIRTPSNPSFMWGNFLFFSAPPGPGDETRWRHLFAEGIGEPPTITHLTFGWDTTTGERGYIQPFLEAGFTLDEGIVLTAQVVDRPEKYNPEVDVRPLTIDEEWDAALRNQIACREEKYSPEGYTTFKERQMAGYRKMAEAGHGAWYGAFLDGKLVGDLGLFVCDGVGRFQAVGTHPDFQRLGVCSTLVYEAASDGFRRFGTAILVIVADEHYHAARIYESVGFKPTERTVGIEWWERPAA